MESITEYVVSWEDMEHQSLMGPKIGLFPHQSGVVASFLVTYPSVFVGPKEDHARQEEDPGQERSNTTGMPRGRKGVVPQDSGYVHALVGGNCSDTYQLLQEAHCEGLRKWQVLQERKGVLLGSSHRGVSTYA